MPPDAVFEMRFTLLFAVVHIIYNVSLYIYICTHCAELLSRLATVLDQTISCQFDDLEPVRGLCTNSSCPGQPVPISSEQYIKLRSNKNKHPCTLKCSESRCGLAFESDQYAMMQLNELFCEICPEDGRIPFPTDARDGRLTCNREVICELRWFPPKKVLESDEGAIALYRALMKMMVQRHLPNHTSTCKSPCRYKAPFAPCKETKIVIDESGTVDVRLRRSQYRIWIAQGSDDLSEVMGFCNNFVQYVKDFKIAYYYGAYQTKSKKQNAGSLAAVVQAATRYITRRPGDTRPAYARGLGLMMACIMSHTRGEIVGSPLAAYLLLGNNIFDYSHPIVRLPLSQGKSWLLNKATPLRISIATTGALRNGTVLDYVHRPQELEALSWWEFVRDFELVPVKAKTSRSYFILFALLVCVCNLYMCTCI